MMRLLTPPSQQAKMSKTLGRGVYTAALHLAPHDLSGVNVCPWASKGCIAACLNTSGRGAFPATQKARIARTRFFTENRKAFMMQLLDEIIKHVAAAKRRGMIPAVRLNATSDIRWEDEKVVSETIFDCLPEVQFYDYTKYPPGKRGILPANYALTFSLSEHKLSVDHARSALRYGWNVAVVYDEIPVYCDAEFNPCSRADAAFTVFDGDKDDARFLQAGLVIGLKAKGRAKADATGFVRRPIPGRWATYYDRGMESVRCTLML